LKEKLAGKFIVLDGPDGCGKTTQVTLLAEWLNKQGVQVLTLRDPGATAIGEKVRQILLNPEHVAMGVRTELLLYMAARAQLWEEKIAPALEQGKCVLLDRWLSSTCAYQGYAGGFGIENVIKVAEGCLERVWPDLIIILDADIQTAAKRLDKNLDRMEQKGQEYHKKVRQGFLELAKDNSSIVIADGTEDIEKVRKKIVQVLQELIS
jgi:dTMP kinase